MSMPLSAQPGRRQAVTGEPFTVEPTALEALAAELDALAAELAGDTGHTLSLAATFPVALGGEEGRAAGATATAWASLQEVLAHRTRAVAGTLAGAADAYRAEDAALSGHLGLGRLAGDRGPR
jgi:hypothetical protein